MPSRPNNHGDNAVQHPQFSGKLADVLGFHVKSTCSMWLQPLTLRSRSGQPDTNGWTIGTSKSQRSPQAHRSPNSVACDWSPSPDARLQVLPSSSSMPCLPSIVSPNSHVGTAHDGSLTSRRASPHRASYSLLRSSHDAGVGRQPAAAHLPDSPSSGRVLGFGTSSPRQNRLLEPPSPSSPKQHHYTLAAARPAAGGSGPTSPAGASRLDPRMLLPNHPAPGSSTTMPSVVARYLHGRLPRKGAKAAALERARAARRRKRGGLPQVHFEDALTAASTSENPAAVEWLIQNYIEDREAISSSRLQHMIDVLADHPFARLPAITQLIRLGYFFTALKAATADAGILRCAERAHRDAAHGAAEHEETEAEVVVSSWTWQEPDKQLFVRTFRMVQLVASFVTVTQQLEALPGVGPAAELAKVEKRMLFNLVQEFIDHLNGKYSTDPVQRVQPYIPDLPTRAELLAAAQAAAEASIAQARAQGELQPRRPYVESPPPPGGIPQTAASIARAKAVAAATAAAAAKQAGWSKPGSKRTTRSLAASAAPSTSASPEPGNRRSSKHQTPLPRAGAVPLDAALAKATENTPPISTTASKAQSETDHSAAAYLGVDEPAAAQAAAQESPAADAEAYADEGFEPADEAYADDAWELEIAQRDQEGAAAGDTDAAAVLEATTDGAVYAEDQSAAAWQANADSSYLIDAQQHKSIAEQSGAAGEAAYDESSAYDAAASSSYPPDGQQQQQEWVAEQPTAADGAGYDAVTAYDGDVAARRPDASSSYPADGQQQQWYAEQPAVAAEVAYDGGAAYDGNAVAWQPDASSSYPADGQQQQEWVAEQPAVAAEVAYDGGAAYDGNAVAWQPDASSSYPADGQQQQEWVAEQPAVAAEVAYDGGAAYDGNAVAWHPDASSSYPADGQQQQEWVAEQPAVAAEVAYDGGAVYRDNAAAWQADAGTSCLADGQRPEWAAEQPAPATYGEGAAYYSDAAASYPVDGQQQQQQDWIAEQPEAAGDAAYAEGVSCNAESPAWQADTASSNLADGPQQQQAQAQQDWTAEQPADVAAYVEGAAYQDESTTPPADTGTSYDASQQQQQQQQQQPWTAEQPAADGDIAQDEGTASSAAADQPDAGLSSNPAEAGEASGQQRHSYAVEGTASTAVQAPWGGEQPPLPPPSPALERLHSRLAEERQLISQRSQSIKAAISASNSRATSAVPGARTAAANSSRPGSSLAVVRAASPMSRVSGSTAAGQLLGDQQQQLQPETAEADAGSSSTAALLMLPADVAATMELFQRQLTQAAQMAQMLGMEQQQQQQLNAQAVTQSRPASSRGLADGTAEVGQCTDAAAAGEAPGDWHNTLAALEADQPPTVEEVQEYARYLGMDPVADASLLYIAEWALTAPIPEGWTVHLDQQGNEFFYNTETAVSCYEHPMDTHFRELYKKARDEQQQQQQQL